MTRPSWIIAALLSLGLALGAAAQDAPSGSAPPQEAAGAEAAPGLPPEIVDPAIPPEELTVRLVPLTRDELGEAAVVWRGIVKDATQRVVDAQIALLRSEGELADRIRERIVDRTRERDDLFKLYGIVVDAWEQKGGAADAVAEFRAYRNSIIVEETRSADAETLAKEALAWATAEDGGVEVALRFGVIAASLIGLLIAARVVRRLVRRAIGRVPSLSKLLQSFLVMVVYWLVLAFGLLVVLAGVGIDISPVFALIGGASFILAFAFQDTLGNLASGLMIMINRPFDEGDYVDIAGTAGTVKSVSIVATQVVTPDNKVIVIPNKSVWGNVITNFTTSPTRRVDLTFSIGYGDSIAKAQKILEGLVAGHPLVLREPAPTICVNALGANSVDFVVRPWTESGDYWTVYWDLTREVKEAFDAAGVTIPFPQQDVHLHLPDGVRAPVDAVSAPHARSRGVRAVAADEPAESGAETAERAQ